MTAPVERIFERHDDSFGAYFDATEHLERRESAFQDIHVFATAEHGRVMMIDGLTMLTERTHHVYHELMTHVPMACVDNPRAALVIGGGDGGAVTELVKHQSLETIVLAELDGAVVEMGRRWFPEVAKGLDDPRVTIEIGDGAAYLAAHENAFDVVVIDSTDICEEASDTTEVASPLATDAFYDNLKRALRPQGVAVQVLGSLVCYRQSLARLMQRLDRVWPTFAPLRMAAPFYITGEWASGLFTVDGRLEPRNFPLAEDALVYLNPAIARCALTPTNDLKRLLAATESA